ncbi:MAG: hypothetical protein JWL58_5504 [Streptosporangiaceae bacterium]|jgi:hypothetical protein|nr:hypothetical protein [Streptosporangiaceae bacterium]
MTTCRSQSRPLRTKPRPGGFTELVVTDKAGYAENARVLMVTAAEEQDPAGSHEPKGQNHP